MTATLPAAQPGMESLLSAMVEAGIRLVAVVPDHQYDRLIPALYADRRIKAVPVAREDEGIAICCGAFYGGVPSAMLMANSGFMLTPYTVATLAMFHRIPLLMLISHRGGLGERAQFQEYQGLLTEPLLRAMGITTHVIDQFDKLSLVGEGLRYTRIFKRPVALLLEGELHRPMTPVYLEATAPGGSA
jgi:sulfopyruvate decarboxylase subunit alpha